MIDWRWGSKGGLFLDGAGDIAFSSSDGLESLKDMVRTRLKAALNGWKLYAIGADLELRIGNVIDDELELALTRQVVRSLTTDFLPSGSFEVQTLAVGDKIRVMVYVNKTLLAQTTVSLLKG